MWRFPRGVYLAQMPGAHGAPLFVAIDSRGWRIGELEVLGELTHEEAYRLLQASLNRCDPLPVDDDGNVSPDSPGPALPSSPARVRLLHPRSAGRQRLGSEQG